MLASLTLGFLSDDIQRILELAGRPVVSACATINQYKVLTLLLLVPRAAWRV
jgi:hypothetical protein